MSFFEQFRILSDEPEFFDEGPRVALTRPNTGGFHNTGSLDTVNVDAYRQGVEITSMKHFGAGIVKIHAGEPGHMLKRNRFGMDTYFRPNAYFSDIDQFVPEDFLNSGYTAPVITNAMSLPLVTIDNLAESFLYDGVVEPLTIRTPASYADALVEPEHSVRGCIMGGNSWLFDQTSSESIQTLYVTSTLHPVQPYCDKLDDSLPFPGEDDDPHTTHILPLYKETQTKMQPFLDVRYIRNTIHSASHDSDIDAALSMMTSSTDNYIADVLSYRSMPCGWQYENTPMGTDSITFGGRTH